MKRFISAWPLVALLAFGPACGTANTPTGAASAPAATPTAAAASPDAAGTPGAGRGFRPDGTPGAGRPPREDGTPGAGRPPREDGTPGAGRGPRPDGTPGAGPQGGQGGPGGPGGAGGPGPQQGQRLEGKVKLVEGDKVTLADGPSFTLAPNARLIKRQAATLADLQPGQYVAITAKLQPDGGLLASIVNVFPPEMANTAPGQRPMAGGNLMTNATIEKADGRNFTATFPGGSAKIQLTPDAELTKLAVMTKADLKEGVTVTAQIANGVAQFVNVQ